MTISRPYLYGCTLAIAIAATACGGDDNDNDSHLTVSVSPAALTVNRLASSSVTVTLARKSTGSSVTLAVSGAPSGVTATFDSATTTSDTTTLTIAAANEAALGSADLTVSATEDGTDATAKVALTVAAAQPMTITGTMANANGVGYPGAIIHVFGQGAAASTDTTTNNGGEFTVANVVPPYDVVAVLPAGNRAFIGLTSATPYLGTILDSSNASTTPVNGSVTVVGGSANANTLVQIFTANGNGTATVAAGDTNFATTVTAPLSGTTFNATVRALQYELDGANNPSSYLGYQEFATNLTTSPTPDVAVAPTGPIPSHTLSVRVTPPAGTATTAVSTVWLASEHGTAVLGSFNLPASDTTSFVMPTDDRIKAVVSISVLGAKSGTALFRTLASTTTSLDVVVPPGATNPVPADAAIGIDDNTVLSIDPIAGATYLFSLSNTTTPSAPSTYVVSGTPSISVARLRALGVPLASGATYAYTIACFFSGTTTDPLAKNRMNLLELVKNDVSGYRAVVNQTFSVKP